MRSQCLGDHVALEGRVDPIHSHVVICLRPKLMVCTRVCLAYKRAQLAK